MSLLSRYCVLNRQVVKFDRFAKILSIFLEFLTQLSLNGGMADNVSANY